MNYSRTTTIWGQSQLIDGQEPELGTDYYTVVPCEVQPAQSTFVETFLLNSSLQTLLQHAPITISGLKTGPDQSSKQLIVN